MTPGLSHIPKGAMIGAAALLAACSQPKLTGEESDQLSVTRVTVLTAGLEQPVDGRQNTISAEQLAADITALLNQRVANRPGLLQAELLVDVKNVNLVPRGVSALAPIPSTSTVVMRVTELLPVAEDDAAPQLEEGEEPEFELGRIIVPDTEFTATSTRLRGAGIIGAATAPGFEKDYRQTLNGLANAIEKRLYGDPEQ
ncbi:MAG: hypothetical protein AAGL23_11315 [Pseudomonadota bacterium]